MCVIAVKSAGAKLDDTAWRWLKNCYLNNDDGAGFMYPVAGAVHIEKGLMTWDAFEQALKSHYQANHLDHKDLVAHFRIATHGKVCAGNCHPFPVTTSTAALTATSIRTAVGMAHNGILNVAIPKDSPLSDSQVFARDWLGPIANRLNRHTLHLLWLTNSRFAFLMPTEVKLVGDFETERAGGWRFSNGTYKQVYRTAPYCFGSDALDDDATSYINRCDWCQDQVTAYYVPRFKEYVCMKCAVGMEDYLNAQCDGVLEDLEDVEPTLRERLMRDDLPGGWH